MSTTVNDPCQAYLDARAARDEADTLLGGTVAMREAGETYLPKHERESQTKYNARIARSFLYNVFKSTVNGMSGKPFEREPTIDPVDEFYDGFLNDVDRQTVDVATFGQDIFKKVLAKGITFILVDSAPIPEGETLSKLEEAELGIRPYWVHVHEDNLIGWEIEAINGVKVITLIRIRESVAEKDDDFGEKWVDQVRVIAPDYWQVWRQDGEKSKNWVIREEGPRSVGRVTLVPVQADRAIFMESEPPLKALAEKNIEHWQSSSDQRNILHVSRVPLLFAKDIDLPEDEAGNKAGEVSTGSMITSSSQHGDLKWVELSGDGSIVQGQADVERLVDEMESLGGQLMFRKAGSSKTATEENIKESKGDSVLHGIIANVEAAFNQAFMYTDLFTGSKAESPRIKLYRDFSIHNPNTMTADDLLKAYMAGGIPYSVYVEEMKARGLRTQLSAEDMQDEMGAEAVNLPEETE